MSVEQVLAVAERLGADLSVVVVGREVDRMPEAPSHRWIVIPVGTPLDHIGNESGHFLSLLDTPMSARSLPPTDLAEPRTGYLVTAPLPDEVQVSRTPPWFGHPAAACWSSSTA